jgi:hypothetical protein
MMQEASRSQSVANNAPGDRIRWGWAIGTAVGLDIVLVISAFAWVAIYSYLIHPGEGAAYYQDYAKLASPFVSVVLGMPYWFLACRWVGQKAGTRAVAMCLWAWFILVLIELPLSFLGDLSAYIWLMVAISLATKLLGAYLGGRAALQRVSMDTVAIS